MNNSLAALIDAAVQNVGVKPQAKPVVNKTPPVNKSNYLAGYNIPANMPQTRNFMMNNNLGNLNRVLGQKY